MTRAPGLAVPSLLRIHVMPLVIHVHTHFPAPIGHHHRALSDHTKLSLIQYSSPSSHTIPSTCMQPPICVCACVRVRMPHARHRHPPMPAIATRLVWSRSEDVSRVQGRESSRGESERGRESCSRTVFRTGFPLCVMALCELLPVAALLTVLTSISVSCSLAISSGVWRNLSLRPARPLRACRA